MSAVFVGSTPSTLEYFFFTSSKKDPSLQPISKILGFFFLENLTIFSSIEPKLFIFS